MESELLKLLPEGVATSEHWKLAGLDMLKALDKLAAEFVQTNMPIAINMTEDEVAGLLVNAFEDLPAVIPVPVDASEDVLLIASRINKVRAAAFALTMSAQEARNIQSKQIEDNAKAMASKVGKSLLGILIGAATGRV